MKCRVIDVVKAAMWASSLFFLSPILENATPAETTYRDLAGALWEYEGDGRVSLKNEVEK